tara:strand:+ start:935 stop:1834 length:900 start_codon:yes stop_codon:yes gene_type:complete
MSTRAGTAGEQTNVVRAIVFIVVGMTFFGLSDALAKLLVADLPVFEVVWARYTFHFIFLFVLLRPRSIGRLVRTAHPRLQITRSAVHFMAAFCAFLALRYLPLAEATAIAFVWPLLACVLSVPILKERVGMRRWTAIAVGLAGALIIIRPGLGIVHWAAFLALGMALFYATYHVLTRKVGTTDPFMTSLFYMGTVGVLITSLTLPFIWVAPDQTQWLLLATLGLSGATSHFCVIQALQNASASTLAPFGYVHLVSATFLGYLIFGALPDIPTIIGSLIIVASGMFLFYRERIRARGVDG